MEFEQILRLVETVAAAGLTEFDYEAVSYTHLTLPTN